MNKFNFRFFATKKLSTWPQWYW